MTDNERGAELGRLLRERVSLQQTINCLKSKLLRASRSFRMAATAIDNDWASSLEKIDEGLPVPNEYGQDLVVPELDDLIRWIKERKSAEDRLTEVNGMLPD